MQYCDSSDHHVILLLTFLIDVGTGLMGPEEVAYHLLVYVVWNLIFDAFHVLIEFGEVPVGGMGVTVEEQRDIGLWLALFGEER